MTNETHSISSPDIAPKLDDLLSLEDEAPSPENAAPPAPYREPLWQLVLGWIVAAPFVALAVIQLALLLSVPFMAVFGLGPFAPHHYVASTHSSSSSYSDYDRGYDDGAADAARDDEAMREEIHDNEILDNPGR